jgi:RHS repeat-associated protein
VAESGHHYVYDEAGNIATKQVEKPGLAATMTTYGHNSLKQLNAIGGTKTVIVRGETSEPASVKLRSNANHFTPAATTAANEFSGWVEAQAGSNTIIVEARDTSPNGNIRTSSYTLNVTGSSRTPAYDLNGNTTNNGTGQTYDWDAENRLIKITYADGSKSEFTYDGLSRRVRIIERNASSAITIVARYDYDPYGKRSVLFPTTDDTFACDLGYTGHITQPSPVSGQVELVLTHFRAYDAELGRWLSPDPLESVTGEMAEILAEGPNLYAYVGNRVITYIDRFGLDWEYSQSTGQVTHVDNKTGKRTHMCNGYSGKKGPHRNNPDSQHLKDQGPIPRGKYTIEKPRNSKRTGPHVMDLKPDQGNDMGGRGDFQIHGDNSVGDASTGCIILSRSARERISSSGDNQLNVVK